MSHTKDFMAEVAKVAGAVECSAIEKMVEQLAQLRFKCGRLFILGIGGSAANASHAASDFRKLCDIEAYAATDNVAEVTARTNDEGWNTVFNAWLDTSRMSDNDAILVLSVGGGTQSVSSNLVNAIRLAKGRGTRVFAIIGKIDGYAAGHADTVIIVPSGNPEWVTPLSESFQMVIIHLLVSDPKLQIRDTKW